METQIKNTETMLNSLTNTTEVAVRFSEVDALGIVWHGHYVKFFEDGREAFGKQYGLGYLDVYEHEFATPIVSMSLDYKKFVKYGDSVIVETTFINSPAAIILFHYKVFRLSDGELVATGKTKQVFINKDQELFITTPPFFEKWKEVNKLN